MVIHLLRIVVLAAGVLLSSLQAAASDWPQYRGPTFNGVSAEPIRTNWAAKPPALLWKVSVGPALSTFTVSGGRVFTQVRRTTTSSQEWCVALDAATGKELWAKALDKAVYPDGGVGDDDGPRSTPTVDGDRVFVLTSYLQLYCLRADTGAVVWHRDFPAELGSSVIAWQNAASPLVFGDAVYLNCNASGKRLMAVKKSDGTVLWQGQDDRMTQATPVLATVAGVPQVIFFTQTGLVSVSPSSGSVYWRYAMSFSTATAASPVVCGDQVFCSAAYSVGAGLVRVATNGTSTTATQVWKKRGALMNHWSTPVYYQGFLYGVFGQSVVSLRCVEVATGVEKWAEEGVGTGGLLLVGGLLMVQSDDGDVFLVRPDPSGYSEIARFKAVSGKCWNVPAISNGRLYVRSTTQAAAYDIAPPVLPKLKLRPELGTVGGGPIVVSAAAEDGSPLDASRAGLVELLGSTNGVLGPWVVFQTGGVLTNGMLRFQAPTSQPSTLLRTRENR